MKDHAGIQVPTFEAAARALHAELLHSWKNAKHGDQWINTLTAYIPTTLGQRTVVSLTPKDFAEALREDCFICSWTC